MDFKKIRENLLKREDSLSKYAIKSIDSIRVKEEPFDIRTPFFHDIDRIIHSISYTRYMDKTQVFSFMDNDHISKRIVHVQLVSKIARTIGRCLNLNEDLIEAIALGHDIGHTPIGHVGESILNEISLAELGEYFMHNVQSVRTYLTLDNNGNGSNLSIQVLDGILCHNGEMLNNIYRPNTKKTMEDFFREYQDCYKDKEVAKTVHPMTLEGCVVRISDIIAYIGRDIEDAIQVGALDRASIPKDIVAVLGNDNRSIVNTIILDIINNSYNKPYIKLSEEVYEAIFKLKNFNYQNIYNKANDLEHINYYRKAFRSLFDKYLWDLENKNMESDIYKLFLDKMSSNYVKNSSNKRIVIDFIAGMTDDYFKSSYEHINKQPVN